MQSIKEMQELENIKWKRTYEAYGRNINVDVFIDIPNVESIPIIDVEAYKAVKSDTLNRSEYALKQIEEDGWSLYYEEPFLGEYLDNTLGIVGRISVDRPEVPILQSSLESRVHEPRNSSLN